MLKPKNVVNSDARYSDPVWSQLAPVIVREAATGDIATPSPARSLQSVLETTLAEGPRWSARRRLAMVVGASLAGWVLIILAIRALF
jgi:hypothetical protein